MAIRKLNEVVEVKDKQGNVLGTYVYTEIPKADTYIIECSNKAGNSFTVTKEITKADITSLVTQAFNVNVRNYVAGLARPSKPSKLKAFEEYFAEKGIDVVGVDTETLISKLKDLV